MATEGARGELGGELEALQRRWHLEAYVRTQRQYGRRFPRHTLCARLHHLVEHRAAEQIGKLADGLQRPGVTGTCQQCGVGRASGDKAQAACLTGLVEIGRVQIQRHRTSCVGSERTGLDPAIVPSPPPRDNCPSSRVERVARYTVTAPEGGGPEEVPQVRYASIANIAARSSGRQAQSAQGRVGGPRSPHPVLQAIR